MNNWQSVALENIANELKNIREILEKQSTNEVEEGEWIEHKRAEEYDGLMKPSYECSQCHDWLRERSNYCPNCGAKMKGYENGTVKSKSE